jgi:uncharacterized membrane protein
MFFINLDYSLINKKALIYTLIKVFIFKFCAHLVSVLYFNDTLFNEKFLAMLMAIFIGFILFYVFFEPVVAQYFKKSRISNTTTTQSK